MEKTLLDNFLKQKPESLFFFSYLSSKFVGLLIDQLEILYIKILLYKTHPGENQPNHATRFSEIWRSLSRFITRKSFISCKYVRLLCCADQFAKNFANKKSDLLSQTQFSHTRSHNEIKWVEIESGLPNKLNI
jgi:hypothetical protein